MNSNKYLDFQGQLTQTPINNAYKYETHSEFMKQMKPYFFSPTCIFCSCNESKSLNSEGSFRQCGRCNKQFKAKIMYVK
jgi:hypothetical protein